MAFIRKLFSGTIYAYFRSTKIIISTPGRFYPLTQPLPSWRRTHLWGWSSLMQLNVTSFLSNLGLENICSSTLIPNMGHLRAPSSAPSCTPCSLWLIQLNPVLNDDNHHREEVKELASWCQTNNLLNVCKTKEKRQHEDIRWSRLKALSSSAFPKTLISRLTS